MIKPMAYKNKNKNKAHMAKLKEKGWRADKAAQKRKNDYRSALRGLPKDMIDRMVEAKFGK